MTILNFSLNMNVNINISSDFINGAKANTPIGLSVFAYGAVLGMICAQKGVEIYQLTLMNVFIFAGTSQFIIVDMWNNISEIFTIVAAALLINLRYFLIGASLNRLFKKSSMKDKFIYMHLVADENWAVTIERSKHENITPLFLFGGGICLFTIWSTGTYLGYIFGGFINDPSKYALDFAFIAIFTALCFNLYQDKRNLIPWLFAALIAYISEYFFGGNLYIVLGAIAGSLVGVVLEAKKYE
tara:strand:- start:3 stop:728 length:726 start_codon:yes stop_codon:yes gene_type:complete